MLDTKNKDDVMHAVAELSEAVKSGNAEKEARITAFLEKQETENQKLAGDIAEERKANEALKGDMDKLEKAMVRMPNGSQELDESKKALDHMREFVMKGSDYVDKIKSLELKYLRTDSNEDGGYLVAPEYDNVIIKGITEISNFRKLARVRNIGSESLKIPTKTGDVTVYWTEQGKPTAQSNQTYGKQSIPANKMTAEVPITMEQLQDSSFNMESEINASVVEQMAKLEGQAFLTGTGNTMPEGFLNATGIETVKSGLAADFTFDLLNDLTGAVNKGYKPTFVMNRKTIAYIRKLKDNNGMPLWQAGNLISGIPNQILGYDYYELPDMPDIAAGSTPIAFGDFFKAYTIVDRAGMTIIRDPYTAKGQGITEFAFVKRVGGGVVLPEAVKLGKLEV